VEVVAGFDARREWVESTDFRAFRVLHFATHGIVDDERPELSGIVLSLVDEKGAPQDGFLRLHDIYNLNLPVDLVVLSACETALGKEVKGEGLIGLVRGFMYAGAPAVIASSWKVDDSATAELMTELYRGLFEGKTPATALREAQVAVSKMARFRHPYYWAAFELQGDWR
jgi:CHAT domain-containing protein